MRPETPVPTSAELVRSAPTAPTPSHRSARDKIRTIEELGEIVERSKMAGKTVVHAHGAFDLLHLGHVRHLEAARQLGDILIVTLTADSFVNKGPGRPVFAEQMRAEMLAALEYVHWVGINRAADAVSAIETIKPTLYVKGQDYVNPQGDVTGKITNEREAVERCGGRIAFTDEVTYSSSELINRHVNVFEPHVRDHLQGLRQNGGLDHLIALIDSIKDYRVLFVGDAILDEYQYVVPMGKSAKENMIATRYQDRELFAGGVFAAANHLAGFCRQVDILTCLGGSDSHEEFIREHLKPNVNMTAIERPGAPTTLKRRFIDPSYMRKLFEVYLMDDDPLPPDQLRTIDRWIAKFAPEYDLIVVTDFGHGLIGPSTVEALIKGARFLAVNAQSNSANAGFNLITKYPRADYICIDGQEARLAAHDRTASLGEIAGTRLLELVDCGKLIVTQGKHGCLTVEAGKPYHSIPALAKSVIDTVGAGDAFLAITSPLVAAGGALEHVGFIGNVVGALKVGVVGHRSSIDKASVIKSITALLK